MTGRILPFLIIPPTTLNEMYINIQVHERNVLQSTSYIRVFFSSVVRVCPATTAGYCPIEEGKRGNDDGQEVYNIFLPFHSFTHIVEPNQWSIQVLPAAVCMLVQQPIWTWPAAAGPHTLSTAAGGGNVGVGQKKEVLTCHPENGQVFIEWRYGREREGGKSYAFHSVRQLFCACEPSAAAQLIVLFHVSQTLQKRYIQRLACH